MSGDVSRDLLVSAILANHEIFLLTSVRLEPVLAGLRLTNQTAQTLWLIDPGAAPPSMRSVAAALHCNASNLTFIAKQLEARGYVRREQDPQDRRSHRLVLTEQGRRARDAVIDAAISATPFADCSDADLREVTRLLGRVVPRTEDLL